MQISSVEIRTSLKLHLCPKLLKESRNLKYNSIYLLDPFVHKLLKQEFPSNTRLFVLELVWFVFLWFVFVCWFVFCGCCLFDGFVCGGFLFLWVCLFVFLALTNWRICFYPSIFGTYLVVLGVMYVTLNIRYFYHSKLVETEQPKIQQ